MNKESVLLLQKLDCNCNDCVFMDRDIVEFKLWAGYTEYLQYISFARKRRKQLKSASNLVYGEYSRGKFIEPTERDIRQGKNIETEARKMSFQFDKAQLTLNYGICLNRKGKWNQPVSFLPNTFQSDTQQCFKHRRDEKM